MKSSQSPTIVKERGEKPLGRAVAFVVGAFPQTSEAFIAREIDAVRDRDTRVLVASCRGRRDERAGVIYGPRSRVAAVATLVGALLRRPYRAIRTYGAARRLCRRRTMAIRAAAIVEVMAGPLKEFEPDFVHAHWLHLPSVVAVLLARRLGCPLGVSAHARDIFVPEVKWESIVAEAAFVVTCSDLVQAELSRVAPQQEMMKVVRINHGLPSRFIDRSFEPRLPSEPLRLVSVGRLVSKKGIDLVIEAAAWLQSNRVEFSMRIVGSGPCESDLRELVRRLGVESVEFVGELDADAVRGHYDWADIMVMGFRVAEDGDRDGIPNVVLEAMSAGVAVVAPTPGGLGEVLVDGETGCVVPAESPEALARGVLQLGRDRGLHERVVREAAKVVRDRFDLRETAPTFLDLVDGVIRRARIRSVDASFHRVEA